MNELEKAQLAVEQANQAVLAASETIQKLVAENAALKERNKKSLKFIAEELGDPEFSVESVQTPATDAFTAEIRAQGVDALINSIMNETGLSSDWPMEELRAFAANLRAGRKG